MQFRRRWSARAFWASMVACSAVTAFAAPPAGLPDPAAEAAKLKAACEAGKGQDAVDIRSGIVDACQGITGPIARNDFAGEIVTAWKPLLSDKNADAQLNAAIALGQLHTLSSADVLVNMLNHSNPAIRYWAAKGLGDIPDLKAVGGALLDNAVKALNAALGKETSGLVRKQLVSALAKLADTAKFLDGMDALAGMIQAHTPDQATLEAVSLGLADLESSYKATPNAALNLKIVTVAINHASFASQQEIALLKSRQGTGGALPEGYHANVVAVINNGIKLLNTVAGKSIFSLDTSGVPEEIKLLLDGVIGSSTLGPGQVQKEFPGVLVPPAIKESSTPAPATAATRSGAP